MRQMNLEPITQSEDSQKDKNKYHILKHIYGIQKDGTDEIILRVAMQTQIYGHGEGEEGKGGMYGKSNMETCITIYKVDNQ